MANLFARLNSSADESNATALQHLPNINTLTHLKITPYLRAMYTREQASQARKAFWTTFGQYMRPHPGAEGLKVNWINYKTGYKGLYFRMEVTKQEAFIGIVMNQRDADLRELFFQQFEELRTALHSLLEEEWSWELEATDTIGHPISRIYTTLAGVSVFNQQDWPQIISFLKPRIMMLDEFWSLAKHHFEPFKHF